MISLFKRKRTQPEPRYSVVDAHHETVRAFRLYCIQYTDRIMASMGELATRRGDLDTRRPENPYIRPSVIDANREIREATEELIEIIERTRLQLMMGMHEYLEEEEEGS